MGVFYSVEVHSPSSVPQYCHQGVSCAVIVGDFISSSDPVGIFHSSHHVFGTHRFWLEVVMAAEVEKVQVCRVVPGWEERLVLFTWHCLALGPICHGRAAGMQRCCFCACLVLRETVGWESAPGSHHSLCMQLETKTRPARVGTGSIPWQTPFCAPQLSYEDLSVLTAEMEQIFHSLSKAISTDEPCSRQSSGSTGYIPVCSHTFPPHC